MGQNDPFDTKGDYNETLITENFSRKLAIHMSQ